MINKQELRNQRIRIKALQTEVRITWHIQETTKTSIVKTHEKRKRLYKIKVEK